MKEGLEITEEALSPSFISNVEFFKRYGSNLYGMTGTLGSKKSQEFLEKTYKVDSVIIPPFNKLKITSNKNSKYICKELRPIIKKDPKNLLVMDKI